MLPTDGSLTRMAPEDRTSYTENLTVPWWVWPVSLAAATGLAVEIGLGVPGLVTWLPCCILIPATVGVLVWLSRLRVTVRQDVWTVDDARLPLQYIASAEPLTGTALRDALSAQLHPLAFVVQRPWISGAVRVVLDDPGDPTPYWIVSTRHPHRLAELLTPATRTETRPARSRG